MKHKILILDDDARFLSLIKLSLEKHFEVVGVEDVEMATLALRESAFDAFIIDYQLKNFNALEFLNNWMGPHPLPPVVVISGYANLEMALALLNKNIAGFLEKPTTADEIRAKLNEVIEKHRRQRVGCANHDVFDVRDFVLYADLRLVKVGNLEIKLTPIECKLLSHFLLRPGQVVKRSQLIDSVWNGRQQSSHTLDTHILNLKNKLPSFGKSLGSVYGEGFVYNP